MQRAAVAVSGDVEESIRKHADNVKFQDIVLNQVLSPVGGSSSPLALVGEENGYPEERKKEGVYLSTILNGVNTEHFQKDGAERSKTRKELGIPPTAPVVGTVAVFRFQKRLDLWLEVAAGILKKVPE